MNQEQLKRMRSGKGFIAALDQSGGSTPKALAAYGVMEDRYSNEEEMFDLVHAMRTRIIKSPSFSSEHVIGAILFEMTMDRKIDNKYTADYLWENKGVVPFLKVDKGLAELENGVQLMKDIPGLDETLARANERHIFGTKMRSVIKEYNKEGIEAIVKQQFEIGKQILAADLMPIIEPEVDIHCPDKQKCEEELKACILKELEALEDGKSVMLKLTIPSVANFYKELIDHPKVVRVVALSGGYSREESNELLAKNEGLIASFSRALAEGLRDDLTDEEFNNTMKESVLSIYEASIK